MQRGDFEEVHFDLPGRYRLPGIACRNPTVVASPLLSGIYHHLRGIESAVIVSR